MTDEKALVPPPNWKHPVLQAFWQQQHRGALSSLFGDRFVRVRTHDGNEIDMEPLFPLDGERVFVGATRRGQPVELHLDQVDSVAVLQPRLVVTAILLTAAMLGGAVFGAWLATPPMDAKSPVIAGLAGAALGLSLVRMVRRLPVLSEWKPLIEAGRLTRA